MKKCILLITTILIFLLCFSFAEKKQLWIRFNYTPIKSRIELPYNIYPKLLYNDFKKFVWVNQPLKYVWYEPNDLTTLKWLTHISAQSRHKLRQEAANHLEEMANDFYKTFWTNIVVASAYRSYSYQKNSISESCKQSWWCAREWESEHQLGLAVDLREATNESKFLSKYQKYYDRLHNNAHLYWFHQSYQNWREIDWYYIEPRHRRYLWIDLATKLHEKNITFTQYIKNNY